MKTLRAGVVILAAALLAPPVARAQTPAYLEDMPTVDSVTRGIRGTDPIDTAARQAGAFWQLRRVIRDLALSQHRQDREWTPDEKKLADAYYAARHHVWAPLEKSLAQDRPRLFALEGYNVDPEVLEEVLTKIAGPSIGAEYAKANKVFAARHKALIERNKAEHARAQAEVRDVRAKQEPKPWQRELARCIASGRSEIQCHTESLGKGMTDLFPILKKAPRPAGLQLSGVYEAQGGFRITFTPDAAVLRCREVNEERVHVVEMNGGQLLVKLTKSRVSPMMPGSEAVAKLVQELEGPERAGAGEKPLVLPLRPDGQIAASGIIDVAAPVRVGTRHGTRTVDEMRGGVVVRTTTEPVVEPVYEVRTARCTMGTLVAIGRASPLVSPSTSVATTMNLALGGPDPSAGKMPPPGLRLNGRYVGEAGFDIEFHPESAVVACRDAVIAHEYVVDVKGTQVLVNIQNTPTPIVLEVRPDGRLAGSGSVQVNGRVIVGTNARDEPVYRPTKDSCTLGVLTAGGSE